MFFILILLFIQLINPIETPNLINGKCVLYEDTIYYIGGQEYSNNAIINNNKIYYLNLKDLLTWKIKGNETPSFINSNIILNNNQIIVIGSNNTSLNNALWNYDIIKDEWKYDFKGNIVLNAYLKSNIDYGYLIKDNTNKLYYFGGKKSIQQFNQNMLIYDMNKQEWKQEQRNINNSNGIAVYIDSTIINLGGIQSNNTFYSTSKIMTQYTNNTDIYERSVSGDIPNNLINVDSTIDDKNIFITSKDNIIYKFKTSNFEWQHVKVDNFKYFEKGCLIYYKNHLIYSFGKINNTYNNHIQIISLDTNKLVNDIILDDNKTNPHLNKQIIIGISVVGALVVIIIILIILYISYKRKVQPEKLLKPPTYLNEMIWANTSKSLKNDIHLLSFNTQIDSEVTNLDKALLKVDYKDAFSSS